MIENEPVTKTGISGILSYLKQLEILDENELLDFASFLTSRSLKKGDYFIREGQVSKEVAFLTKGILRSFYLKENGDELTYCLTFQNNFMTAYSSFITGNPANENLQAITDCEMFVIPKEIVLKLETQSSNWLRFMKHVAEGQYIELEQRIFAFQKFDAKMRYEQLLNDHPEMISKVPVHYLASYLGISARHLGRIRKDSAQ